MNNKNSNNNMTSATEDLKKKFNPTNPKWAVDAINFPPDKAKLYGHPMAEDGWVHSHNALRMEIKDFKGALDKIEINSIKLGSKDLKEWELDAIKKWWTAHKEHVTSHHETEDEIFNPYFRTRIKYPEKLETDHAGLVEIINEIDEDVSNRKLPISRNELVSTLRRIWNRYEKFMLPHLLEEEEVGLPLSLAYFTPEEMAVKVQEVLAKSAKSDLGAFIYCMGERKFREKFMIQEKIPSFVWWISLRFKYRYYADEIAPLIEALKCGTPPPFIWPTWSKAFIWVAFVGVLYKIFA